MALFLGMDIRNIAIIAHVDHGKTTLVDGMLKQTHTFRENQAEMSQTTILDSNELEREKGITILAKNTAVYYRDVKINIIDTPGHADFGGEVERVLNMADAALLVVDASEGPLPQTKFVLEKAFAAGLKIIVVINKIDRKDARTDDVLTETEGLFLRLATDEGHLEFPVIYAVGREGRAGLTPDHLAPDLGPLFELILKETKNAVVDLDKPVQMLVSTLDFDPHLGRLGIGRVKRGVLKVGQRVVLVGHGAFNVERLYTSKGIERVEINEAMAGDIVAIAGIKDIEIGLTIADPGMPEALPIITVEEPTLKMTMGANTSPLAGREGKYLTSRQIGERLEKEIEKNLGMKFKDLGGGEFEVAGRGELHLAILLETMRREGYEMQVSRPQVIMKDNLEPYDEVTIEMPNEFVGVVTTEMGKRKGQMRDMTATKITYLISQRNMIGARNILLTQTKGTMVMHTQFAGYKETGLVAQDLRPGVLVTLDSGKALAYSLENAQERGITFVDPGEDVYEGMIVGLGTRENDVELNVCRGKHLTNTRAASADIKTVLTPALKMSLEQALDFIADDELLEITPKSLRLRKKYLTRLERVRNSRKQRAN
ncbi:GTP-binding protein TypA [Candidatus Amesbacteria bacterium RIFCSPHIGHO2_01_FULL_48_32]|uniref:50S ribosomal subunit assembly factor BipA n=1 Tax=Candidatus Amesbacteria bacterium RIFCSPLOWO2_01_FULL_48_25 TaxID=1797259 RepID=A0A1F4ZDW5_9BACT|nr:MAG: GTP-binding protein TypA [Candidatus Amesbacteria bacterium RIFCSPHIGHO2_01_FULL_48_32]OGD04116.1 MAG: GTP-binding protein TypA [Candidatus Amesbacteria bacterium RIFCSPLOWO2_01_FULL_48_25]